MLLSVVGLHGQRMPAEPDLQIKAESSIRPTVIAG